MNTFSKYAGSFLLTVAVAAAADSAARADEPAPECNGPGVEVNDDEARVTVTVGAAPVKGPKDAKVTVVVFSDFECPYCARTTPLLAELEQKYRGQIRVAFKNKPLPFHKNAPLAAQAALAAGEQGRFWEFHDLLTRHPNALDRTTLEGYARDLGLDARRFAADVDAPRIVARVQADVREADALAVQGTPTTFVNGKRFTGARGRDAFESAIVAELRTAGP